MSLEQLANSIQGAAEYIEVTSMVIFVVMGLAFMYLLHVLTSDNDLGD